MSTSVGGFCFFARKERMDDLDALYSNRDLEAYVEAVSSIDCRALGDNAMQAMSSARAGEW